MRMQPLMTSEEEPTAAPAGEARPETAEGALRGGALDAAREEDRAWREARAAAIQARLEATHRRELLGYRMRERSWPWMVRGPIVTLCAGWVGWSLPEGCFWLIPMTCFLLALGGLAAMLGGLFTLLASKALRMTCLATRKALLRQAARDHLEIHDPGRAALRVPLRQTGESRDGVGRAEEARPTPESIDPEDDGCG